MGDQLGAAVAEPIGALGVGELEGDDRAGRVEQPRRGRVGGVGRAAPGSAPRRRPAMRVEPAGEQRGAAPRRARFAAAASGSRAGRATPPSCPGTDPLTARCSRRRAASARIAGDDGAEHEIGVAADVLGGAVHDERRRRARSGAAARASRGWSRRRIIAPAAGPPRPITSSSGTSRRGLAIASSQTASARLDGGDERGACRAASTVSTLDQPARRRAGRAAAAPRCRRRRRPRSGRPAASRSATAVAAAMPEPNATAVPALERAEGLPRSLPGRVRAPRVADARHPAENAEAKTGGWFSGALGPARSPGRDRDRARGAAAAPALRDRDTCADASGTDISSRLTSRRCSGRPAAR